MSEKLPPTQKAIDLRDKLERLTHSPVEGEAASAARKLTRLLDRYDFAHALNTADIFETFVVRKDRETHPVFTFEAADTDIATLTQWALENSYGIRTSIRGDAICAGVLPGTIPALQVIAETIRSQFITLWGKLAATCDVDATDRKCFMLGLYDGMMDDPRNPGQRLPERTFAPVKKKAGKRAIDRKPGVAIHPYTLALDLGRKIRICASVTETTEALETTISGTIGHKAA